MLRNRWHRMSLSLGALLFVMGVQGGLAAAADDSTLRLDLPKIAKQVQTKGLAEYIPVAYHTVGIESQYWMPADNHARAHFLLYMAKDCSHFVMKWEIPALVPIDQNQRGEVKLDTRRTGIYGGPGHGVCSFKDARRNLLLNSYQVGQMKRIWTRGPFNAAMDAVHTRSDWGPDKWGALIHCGLYLAGGEAGLGAPIAIYNTPKSESGDTMSGAAVMEVPDEFVRTLQKMMRVRPPAMGGGEIGPSLPVPLYWRVNANVFNAAITNSIAKIKEAWVEYQLVGDYAFKVLDVVTIVATAATPEAALVDILVDAALSEIVPFPTGVSPGTGWEVCKWLIGKIVDKETKEMGKLVNVQVLYMRGSEPFQLAPWTFTALSGPGKGTDTWDAIEMRGGYEGRGQYHWIAAAGAITQWAARLSVRPSLMVRPEVTMSCPEATCVVSPTQVTFQLVRDDTNWERVDRYLIENYCGELNAPMFAVMMNPWVNYELLDQEVLRWSGNQTQADAPQIKREQLFRTMSICSGAEMFIGRDRARVDFEARHPDAVTVNGRALPVEVTFERGAMPQGGFILNKGELKVALVEPTLPSGVVNGAFVPAEYQDEWWYVTIHDHLQGWEQRLAAFRELREDNVEHIQIVLRQKEKEWADQAAYLQKWRTDNAEYRRNTIEQNHKQWQATLGERFQLQKGSLVFSAPAAQIASSLEMRNLRLAYVPRFSGVTFQEPIVWQRLVIDKPAEEVPDLEKCKPEMTIEGDRVVVSYQSPRTGKPMTMIVKIPPRAQKDSAPERIKTPPGGVDRRGK